jgi:hypothetical protein
VSPDDLDQETTTGVKANYDDGSNAASTGSSDGDNQGNYDHNEDNEEEDDGDDEDDDEDDSNGDGGAEANQETYNPDTWTPSVQRVFEQRQRKEINFSHNATYDAIHSEERIQKVKESR